MTGFAFALVCRVVARPRRAAAEGGGVRNGENARNGATRLCESDRTPTGV